MRPTRQEVARTELRNGERVIVDRSWVRESCKHRYEVLIVGGGGIIYGYMADTTCKAEAKAEFDRIAKEWGKVVGVERRVVA